MTVIDEIAAERRRQIEVEGWTPEHDDEHTAEQLARAAACYARPDDISWSDNFGRALDSDGNVRPMSLAETSRKWSYVLALRWPWARAWWKPKDRRRNLIKAAALIVAEIERLERAKAGAP